MIGEFFNENSTFVLCKDLPSLILNTPSKRDGRIELPSKSPRNDCSGARDPSFTMSQIYDAPNEYIFDEGISEIKAIY